MKYYIVEENLLKELWIHDLKLAALENGGVDNWEWYGESIGDFLKEQKAENFEELMEKEITSMTIEEVDR